MGELGPQLAVLPERLGPHLLVSLLALLLAAGVGIPLAILVHRRERWAWPVLTGAGVIQTIPGLALLALMVPILVGVGGLLGLPLPAFGFWPALLALSLYALLPILRNTVTGLSGVDPDLVTAANALGMTPTQRLTRVELPLAAPVILAGVRTATVWTVGMATLSTPVGQTSLGNYIFAGLQTRNYGAVLVGCVASAALAIGLDASLGLLERGIARRERPPRLAAGVMLVLILAAGLGPWLVRRGADAQGPDTLRIGAKTFSEQYILASLIDRRLTAAGLPTETVESLGSTVVFDALARGELDVYVDYSGTLWANQLGREDVVDRVTMIETLTPWLEKTHGVRLLGALGFENAYALALRRDAAGGMRTIADLAPSSPELALGGDYEFFDRPEWTRLKETYGLSFARTVSFDSSFMYAAVRDGEVDVITAFSSDGRIAAYDLVTLEDPQAAFPPYDAVLLLSKRAAARPEVVEALSPLIGAIDVARMREANRRVDLDGATRGDAATWLDGQL